MFCKKFVYLFYCLYKIYFLCKITLPNFIPSNYFKIIVISSHFFETHFIKYPSILPSKHVCVLLHELPLVYEISKLSYHLKRLKYIEN
jgi:hypothetical protein